MIVCERQGRQKSLVFTTRERREPSNRSRRVRGVREGRERRKHAHRDKEQN